MVGPTAATASAQRRGAPLKILALTNLFPSPSRPGNGVFLKHRLQHLSRLPGVEMRLIAPVPWFPSTARIFGQYAKLAQTPRDDDTSGIPARFIRYPMLPKISMWITPLSIALSALKAIRDMKRSGFEPDVIDAYYLYPDGVAACLLGVWLRKPVMLTALGTDATQIARQPIPGALICWAARRAIAVTAVCHALIDQLIGCGIAPEKLTVVQHGVDLELFSPPHDRDALRQTFGLKRFTMISVGHLSQNKGQHLAIRALTEIPDVDLLIVGDGPERDRLRALASDLGATDRVRFIGSVDQPHLALLMGAADLLVSCSEYEGISNVLLEALACGTPVAATPVWGSPEIVADPKIGLLFKERSGGAIADGIRSVMRHSWDRSYIRHYSLRYDWAATAEQHRCVMLQGLGAAKALPDRPSAMADGSPMADDCQALVTSSAYIAGSVR
ncbi:glycosyltransferase [Rhizorhabdus dicambivorans]|nr:glycosyltransferase [Rhizorhabdus dicambivorans]